MDGMETYFLPQIASHQCDKEILFALLTLIKQKHFVIDQRKYHFIDIKLSCLHENYLLLSYFQFLNLQATDLVLIFYRHIFQSFSL